MSPSKMRYLKVFQIHVNFFRQEGKRGLAKISNKIQCQEIGSLYSRWKITQRTHWNYFGWKTTGINPIDILTQTTYRDEYYLPQENSVGQKLRFV